MADINITIEQNVNGIYQSIYPATSASLVKYSNEMFGANVTNVAQALLMLKSLYGTDLPITTYNKISTTLTKTQLNQKVNNEYVPIRIQTKAEQVPCYSPFTGQLSNLKNILDDMLPLCFVAKQANSTISMSVNGTPTATVDLKYSTDASTWNTFTPGTTTITLANVGDRVFFKGNNTKLSESTSIYRKFVMTGQIAAGGNIMSLLNGTKFGTTITGNYCFASLFNGCSVLTTAPDLPATTLSEYCYYQMFAGCTALTTAPNLPALIAMPGCYAAMFGNCTSLVNAPIISATQMGARSCYMMFMRCTSLTTPPSLPATILNDYCYYQMFYSCTSLTTLPNLPATTLMQYCYYQMFMNTNVNLQTVVGTTYYYRYRIPQTGQGVISASAIIDMFRNTPGTVHNPALNTVYHTDHEPV